MKAIREIKDVKSGKVTINLPDDFGSKRVEIIILPVEDPSATKEDLQNLLLSGPTLTDEELQLFTEVRGWMSQWNVKNF